MRWIMAIALFLPIANYAEESPAWPPKSPNTPKAFFDARKYGAIGDGVIDDTQSLQRAIDAAAQAGGGSVVLASGRFLSGSIRLKSHVFIKIDEGAVLLGYPRRSAYAKLNGNHALVIAENQEDIGIYGGGTVDGQGEELVKDTRGILPQRNPPFADERERPMIIRSRFTTTLC